MSYFRDYFARNDSKILPLLRLLSKRDKLLLTIVVIINLLLALLDLVGVLLIGAVGSLAITGIGSAETGNRVSIVLDTLGISDLGFEQKVAIVGLFAAGALIFKTLLSLLLTKRVMFFMARRAASLSSDLISKFFSLPSSQINSRSIQNSIYSLTDGVTIIMVGVIGVCVSLLADFILLVVLAIGMFYVDPIMSIGTFLLFSLLAYFLYSSMHEKMRKLGEMQGGLSIESSQKIFEVISSYRELIVRNRRNYYSKLISNARLKLAEGNASISFMSTLSKYILEIALVVGAILLAYYQFTTNSAYRAIATITVFIAASSRITPAILRLQQGFLKMKSSFAGAEPTLDLILELDGVPSDNSPIEKFNKEHADFRPEILVSDLSFRYSGYRNVLENINLDVRAGEFVALVGGSGAGKTTLFDLMIGALEPSKGDVAISGQPPKTAFSKWPGAVAYVPQDIAIIDGSVRENLGLGFPQSEITDDDCWQSLKLVGLEDFVRKLPNSLDTQVGDRGTSLSGGQRQRLGIARALMTKPKLMFLDEATSALDGVTESEISESIRGLTGELTLVVIAHRLSTIKNADRIYLIEDGQIKGMGTFEVLKATYPKFLIQAQIMGL